MTARKATATLTEQTAAKDAAEARAEAAKPPAPKVSNAHKKVLRRAMYDAVKNNVAAEMAKHDELDDYTADVLDTQVDAYLKYLVPEIVRELSANT